MRRHAGIATTLALLVLLVSAGGKCSINERKPSWHDSMRSRATLECRAPPSGRSIMSLFSFSVGGSVSDPRQSDLCFYFDSDDCAGGALVGHHDEKGWLFPIGKRDWRELQREEPQPSEVDSIAAITAITTAQEGVAFWAKTVDGRYALLRIAKVQPSSYDAIRDGKQASIEFEWMW